MNRVHLHTPQQDPNSPTSDPIPDEVPVPEREPPMRDPIPHQVPGVEEPPPHT